MSIIERSKKIIDEHFPAVLALLLLAMLASSQLLKSVFNNQYEILLANMWVSAGLTGAILLTYKNIYDIQSKQSDEIARQVNVIEDQLKANHNPLLSTEIREVEDDTLHIALSNRGNGVANDLWVKFNFEFSSRLEALGEESDFETKTVRRPLSRVTDEDNILANYLEPGESHIEFEVPIIADLHHTEGRTMRMSKIIEYLRSKDTTNHHFEITIEYETVIGEKEEFQLPQVNVLLNSEEDDVPYFYTWEPSDMEERLF